MSEEENKPAEGEQPDPIAEKAKSSGWRPKEEFEGDPEAWVDAGEFLRRAPLYEKNRNLKKELAELKSTIHDIKQHVGKVAEATRNKVIAELSAKRDEAIEMGDKEQVKEIDKEIDKAKTDIPTDDGMHPAIKSWISENQWFDTDEDMRAFAISHNDTIQKRNPNMTVEGSLEKTLEAVKKAFPEKFAKPDNNKRKDPPAVETGGKGDGKKTFTKSDLNDEQRKVMNKFVRQGVMSEEEYIKELADSGILGGKK